MAAKNKFSFEDPPSRSTRPQDVDFSSAPAGALPDFGAFGNINLDSVSPAIGVTKIGAKYTPMNRGAEYLFDDEERERNFFEHVTYYCGTSYLSGMTIGGVLGFFEGLRKSQGLKSSKLRQNAIVNGMTKRGPNLAANLATLALFFTTTERVSLYSRDKDDALNSIIAASATGFLFNCASGPRLCIVWTLLGGAGMALVTLTGHAHTVLHRAKVNPINP